MRILTAAAIALGIMAGVSLVALVVYHFTFLRPVVAFTFLWGLTTFWTWVIREIR